MKFLHLDKKHEQLIIRFGLIVYWWLFWLLNVVDKFIGESTFFWVGKDRLSQFIKYFASIGIENNSVAIGFLVFTTVIQIVALVFSTLALWYLFTKKKHKEHGAFYLTILASLFVFSFFAIGDQIFGDRVELLEHSIYWIILVISWFVYTKND